MPLAVTGIALGLVVLLVTAVGCVLYVSPVRQTVLDKALPLIQEKTGLDIDPGRIYLSPLHHSPMVFYRAYKGQADLPLTIEIDSVFVGHRGQDTLLCVQSLRLNAIVKVKGERLKVKGGDFLDLPIEVEHLRLENTTFHSDSMIASVGVDVIVGLLDVHSPELVIAKGQYPLHGLQLNDVFCGIDLRGTPPDTTEQEEVPPLKLCFDVPDGELRNIHFALTPLDLHVRTRSLSTNTLVDVGGNRYDAHRLEIGGLSLAIGSQLDLPFDTVYGQALADLSRNLITSPGLHVRSDELGAEAHLRATKMSLSSMRIDVEGEAEYQGSKANLSGYYDIDDEAYEIEAAVERVNLSAFLQDSVSVVMAGNLHAKGRGIDPKSDQMESQVQLHLTDAIYEDINVSGLQLDAQLAHQTVEGSLHLPVKMKGEGLRVKGETEHQFRVAQFMTPSTMRVDYRTQMRNVNAQVAGESFQAKQLDLHFMTDTTTSVHLTTRGLTVDAHSPMHVLSLVDTIQPLLNAVGDSAKIASLTSLTDLTVLDTLRHLIPEFSTHITLTQGSPAQTMIERMGLDVHEIDLVLTSDTLRTDLSLDASIPVIEHPQDSTALRLPAAHAALRIEMAEGTTTASLTADTRLTDGAMSMHGLCTDAALRLDLTREENMLHGDGRLTLDSISYEEMDFGNRAIDMHITPSQDYAHALRVDVRTDDIPLDIVGTFVELPDITLGGAVRARATVDGLPGKTDISAEVLPIGVSAEYTPYKASVSLGEIPIVMEHNHVDFNGLPIYGADSTFIALTGGLDLDSMRLDISITADSLVPVHLPQGGPIPVYGELATDIRGTVTGPLDSIVADVSVTILPNTDITYPIDKKNLAQVKPHGTARVRFAMADSVPLTLGGQINVDDGFVRYSPKAYPIMPFHVDSGSHIAFNGPIGQTMVDVSASQQVKASSQSEGEDVRMVDFRTGVRVHGIVDSLDIGSIGFFLEAPNDEVITEELKSIDEETREGLAATLLATGMYMGESNASAHESGYALTSIINSRINAAMTNSKRGKVIDIDVSSGTTQRATGETNDLNIAISKSFFNDRMKLSVGAALSDSPDAYKNASFLNNISAEFKLTKDGMVSLRAFGQRDYNNILEGELIKSGIGVRAIKEWRRMDAIKNSKLRIKISADSIARTYGLIADADVAWRSNNSLGPNLTLTHSIKNLLGRGEVLTIKGNGAYYWALRNRHPGDPKKTDTYKLGVNASLVFPYLHWLGDHNPDGDTRYMVGYQYENIAGGYGVHKEYGSFTYFIRTSKYITHAFTPFSVSLVLMKAEADDLANKAMEYPQLMRVMIGDELVASVGYDFIYNNYRSKRPVNTMFSIGIKESGNLINAIHCAFGYKWLDPLKVGTVTFNQFVKMTIELRNKYNLTDQVCFATRFFAGANIPTGGSGTPLSEAFYAGGPNSMRSAAPYAYGPGNFYSEKYNQNFFHAGDIKLEVNGELRFPIVWKLFGAAFVDAGNVWNWVNTGELFIKAGVPDYKEKMQLREDMQDGIFDNPDFFKQIALGTGAGLRLDLDGLVIRLDFGVAIHAPYKTYKYDKDGKVDETKPINTYFNIPSALDAIRVNFGIGYPF